MGDCEDGGAMDVRRTMYCPTDTRGGHIVAELVCRTIGTGAVMMASHSASAAPGVVSTCRERVCCSRLSSSSSSSMVGCEEADEGHVAAAAAAVGWQLRKAAVA